MIRPSLALLGFPLTIIGIFALWQFVHKVPAGSYVLTPLPSSNQIATAIASPVATHTKNAKQATTTPAEVVAEPSVASPLIDQPTPPQTYLKITTGCVIALSETCVTAHSRRDSNSAVRSKLRIGTVLFVKGTVTDSSGALWYEIDFPESLRYPERLTLPWYIKANAGVPIRTNAPSDLSPTTPTTSKMLLVDRSDQTLYAYEGERKVHTYTVSTGRELTPTPRGEFVVYRKTPSRYMQGPIPGISTNYYDLPGVPWNLYFTEQGAVVHGAYWHNDFGNRHSNGCVNVDPEEAEKLYEWADLGTKVIVRD
jgi:lipoprotein-anchoring transpeptidase ErfK/SrfK